MMVQFMGQLKQQYWFMKPTISNRHIDDIARCNSKCYAFVMIVPDLVIRLSLHLTANWIGRMMINHQIGSRENPARLAPIFAGKNNMGGNPWFLVDGPLNPIHWYCQSHLPLGWGRCLDTNHQLNEIRPWFHSNTARSLSHRRWWHYCRTQNFPKFRLIKTFQYNYYSTASVP